MVEAGLRGRSTGSSTSRPTDDGHLSPIGNGWWQRGGERSRFDQQPIEATALLLAAEAAYEVTGDRALPRGDGARLRVVPRRATTSALPVADPARGACCDGLDADGVNTNQGAESTLMWLIALEHIRALRQGRPTPPPVAERREGAPGPVRRPHRASRAGRGRMTRAHEAMLFQRSAANPILTAADVPYPANSVFNPGAARVGDETILLLRVEDLRGISQLHVARSTDGVTDWRFDPEPLLRSDVEQHPEEIWGCEDPRLTWLPEREEWAIAYTAYSRRGPLVSLAMTRDFRDRRAGSGR